MDMTYVEYCYADPYFYETIHGAKNASLGRNSKYRIDSASDWSDWRQVESNGWLHVMPLDSTLPDQGWKIHCSATKENAQEILQAVSAYCFSRRIHFKFLPSATDLFRSNVKYAPRGGSGKFITIYPVDSKDTERILHDLDRDIGGYEGPYILSDLRYNEGPLYVRYGAYKQDFVRNEFDELVPAIRRPDGELEPDHRLPTFSPPEWVELPEFVVRMKEALGSGERPDEFAYEITESLHFSNGGGIYKGRSLATGRQAVLKEARPHAGLTPDGRDAVSRLEQEADFLRKFGDLDQVVNLQDQFVVSGHHFLVEDYVPGITLNKAMVARNPLIRADQTREDRLAYRDWALGIMAEVEEALRSFHREGVVFGDLHPNNIIVTDEGRPVFIDFEMAYPVDEVNVIPTGAPGYMAGDGRTGIPADLYALGCTKLSLFFPLTVLIPLDPLKLRQLVDAAQRAFELPDEYCREILRDIGIEAEEDANCLVQATRSVVNRWDMSSPEGVEEVLTGIASGIWESADFSRADRVFPGDPHQFIENGVGIAYGACGNLLANPGTDAQRERTLDWIEYAAKRLTKPSYGFYDGLAGIAYTLRTFGREDAADAILSQLLKLDFALLTSDLYGGLAGIGIYLMDEAERRPTAEIQQAIASIRDVMARRLDEPVEYVRYVDGTPTSATDKGGLMRGMAGHAVYWVRSFEYSGEETDLDRAEKALDVDLALCIEAGDGSIQLNEGWRTLPYLASGSMGVGLAMLRFREYRKRPGDKEALRRIVRCADPEFAIQSTLFNGRAGFVYFLTQLAESNDADLVTSADMERHANLLGTYAVLNRTGIHFPGDQIMRLSTDWSTGSAGVYAALERYKRVRFGEDGRRSTALPFLGIERVSRSYDMAVSL